MDAGIGFRAHSGWAVAVAVVDGKAIMRWRIETCDCLMAGSAQPYHAAAKMPLPEARRFLKRCAGISTAMAEQAVRKITAELAAGGYCASRCAILLGSGRPLGELEKTLASHPLIHTAEGEFYREILRAACRRRGLPIEGIKERDLRARLGEAADLGRTLGPPWRQDEKLCALAGLQALQSTLPGH
jgi:hypothetical protein